MFLMEAAAKLRRLKMKNRADKNNDNRNIAVISYSLMIIFVLLIAYIVIFLAGDNMELLNNPYIRRRRYFRNIQDAEVYFRQTAR